MIAGILAASSQCGQDLLKGLGQKQDYRSRRISSCDRSGGRGYYVRFADPDGALRYALKPE